jgi:hypothetical protein
MDQNRRRKANQNVTCKEIVIGFVRICKSARGSKSFKRLPMMKVKSVERSAKEDGN